jgi:putative inorganic carbon (hco3(-)) transporter
MSSLSAPSSILPTEQWSSDRAALWMPLVGSISYAAVARLVSRAAFVLLLSAAGTLLVHPGDVVPVLQDVPIYQLLLTACLLLSLRRVLNHVGARALRGNAITASVLLLVPAAFLSHVGHGNLYDARLSAAAVAKVSLLFLLVLALVDTPARLRITLAAIAAFVFAMTVLALLQYHGIVNLPGLARVEQPALDAASGETVVLVRLCGVGLFNDPNDLSLILVAGILVTFYFLYHPHLSRAARPFLLVPLGVFGYALVLTHSRGGMLSAGAGLLVFLCARLGGRNALAVACLLLPVLLARSWGRLTEVDLADPEDTFQTRLELWSGSLDAIRSAPLLGIGQGRLIDELAGHVAHNSYLHAFAEMGLLGGTAFLGAFYLVLRGLWRATPDDPELARLRPYVLALTGAYAAGLLSLSRCYHAPTQLVLALATAYLVLASRSVAGGGGATLVVPRVDGPCFRRVAGVGLLFLAATYVFVRLMLQRGVS